MSTLLILNTISYAIISIVLLIGLLKHFKNQQINKSVHWFSGIGIGYLFLTVMSILWLIGKIEYTDNEFLIIFATVVVAQTIILSKVFSFFIKNKATNLLLVFYIIGIASAFFVFPKIAVSLIIISYLIIGIFAVNFNLTLKVHKNIGLISIIYALTGLGLFIALFLDKGDPLLCSLITNLIFIIFSIFFLVKVKKHPIRSLESPLYKKENTIYLFIKYFIFIIVLTNFSLLSTIGLHEFGHVLAAQYSDCQYKTIFFEENTRYPHTQALCDDESNKLLIIALGPLLPILLGAVLFAIGGKFTKDIALLVIGFNFLASHKDLKLLEFSNSILITSASIGVIFLILGVILLARSRIEEQHLLDFH